MDSLQPLLGTWTTQSTHPAFPGLVVNGVAEFKLLPGGHFMKVVVTTDHPQFPDATSIVGCMERDRDGPPAPRGQLQMHYFDDRGVFRVYDVAIDALEWRMERLASGFSQRFVGALKDDTIVGLWRLCVDGLTWTDDLQITYRRVR